MIVTVYHNEKRGDLFYGFNAATSVLRLAAQFELSDDEMNRGPLDYIYEQLNVGGDMVPATEWTKAYREGANRSLSVGDVIVVADAEAWAVASVGFEKILTSSVKAAAQRYNPAEDDRPTSLPYAWTDGGLIDVDKTLALRKNQ